MGLNFNEVRGEIESLACFEKIKFQTDEHEAGIPWRDQAGFEGNNTVGLRQHVFKNIWEQSLDPRGTNRSAKSKTSSPDELSIDWKNWPPNIPLMPKGLKIPIKEAPQVDLRLSLSGRWDEIVSGTTIVPVNYSDKKFFDNLGGYLNIAQSLTFAVDPPSLLFLNTRAGQFYSVKLHVSNSGVIPRRVRIIPPANPCFTIIRLSDPKDGIAPGNTLNLTVKYRPKTNESVTDVIVFHVEGDGALTVPLISSCMPDPILEVEEWNCGCCVVGIPKTAFFEIKNVGGDGRFWILSEEEFNNEYLECHMKYKRTLIKESTRELVRTHTREMFLNHEQTQPKQESTDKTKNVIGRGEASGMIKRQKDSMDVDSLSDRPTKKKKGKVKPMVYTRCFRIQPACFRLQRNQKVDIKVRYLPKDSNFHYEKLAIMCENGEVRWIAVKGLGIERDSEKLVDVIGQWTGPPVDLPCDPRTKFVMDCGDLISGELGVLSFTITNRSCIPLYFFWSIRPILTNPEASPENAETKIMERFYESTLEDQDGNSFFTGEARTDKEFETWVSLLPITVNPAQGLMEKKQELTMTFTAECPPTIGYYACIISLYVEQVDEDSKQAVLQTLQGLDKDKLNVPISQAELNKHLDSASSMVNFENGVTEIAEDDEESKKGSLDSKGILKQPFPTNQAMELNLGTSLVKLYSSEETEDDENDGYIPLKESLDQMKASIQSGSGRGKNRKDVIPPEAILPIVVTQRAQSDGKNSMKSGSVKASTKSGTTSFYESDYASGSHLSQQEPLDGEEEEEEFSESSGTEGESSAFSGEGSEVVDDKELSVKESSLSDKSRASKHSVDRRESINLHFLEPEDNTELAHDREMNQGHGVYEDLKNYTENVVPEYKLWPNREKVLTPVAEVEIWLHSVPLDVTFNPPFIIANGIVRTQVDRLIKVKNGTAHTVDVRFENLKDLPIPVTCHPTKFSVKPGESFTFKVAIFFERFGEVQKPIKGTLSLPFMSIPCSISTYLRCIGPFLEVLTPTLNFGIVPLYSETMKMIALRNGGQRPIKWVAHIAREALENENKREICVHQTRIRDKRLIRVWPEWGYLEPGESRGLNVYFCAELGGEIVTSVEIMIDGNPESLVGVPVYGTVELPCLVLENGRVLYDADAFVRHPIQTRTCTIINPSGFNIAYVWECPVKKQCKTLTVDISPHRGTIPAKAKMDFVVTVESLLGDDDPLIIHNVFVPCCVEGMQEPLILKLESKPAIPGM